MESDRNSARGQAFIESALLMLAFALAMGLVVLAVHVAVDGLALQNTVRAEAGKHALAVTAGVQSSDINEWQTGRDGIAFTPDDRAVSGYGRVLAPFADNVFSVKEAEAMVEVPPVAQDYILPSGEITIRARAAIPAMGL